MTFHRLVPLLLCAVISQAWSDETKEEKLAQLPSLNEDLLQGAVWKTSMPDFKKKYDGDGKGTRENQGMSAEMRAQLEKQGYKVDKVHKDRDQFDWLSNAKKAMRAPKDRFSLLDKRIGEVIIRGDGKTPKNVSVSIYNKGDDGVLIQTKYEKLLSGWKSSLDDYLGVRARVRSKKGVVATTGWVWTKGDIAYLLEGSIERKTKRAEFVRLRIAPVSAPGKSTKIAERSKLKDNVTKADNGDIYIKGLPMVDQGQKGYCVVASIERVGRYYGLQVDQHEMAQVAKTEDGTGIEDMEKAFKKITGKIHVRTIRLLDYDYKQLERDVKKYNRDAKRVDAYVFDIDFSTHYINPQFFWHKLDPEVFKKTKEKQPKYAFFQRKIKEFVDQGVPLCWTLMLGMFPEREGQEAQQSMGGHMRIIHGYNPATEELLYTDSWGAGHEMKRMKMIEGWCMNMGLYAMVPNN